MRKIRLQSGKGLAMLLLIFLASLGEGIKAQSVSTAGLPAPSSCTSKDLELRDVFLKPKNPCDYGGEKELYLSVFNKTGSTRTSFAAWGDLYVNNEFVGLFTGCIGPVAPGTTTTQVSKVPFTYNIQAGDKLELKNVFLAWTTANTSQTCDVVLANPGGIAPKCGVLPLIPIRNGMAIDVTYTNQRCAANGVDRTATVNVKVSGGVPSYTITVAGSTKTATQDNQVISFDNVPAGAATVTVSDNDPAKTGGCSASKSITVPSAPAVTPHTVIPFAKTCSLLTSGAAIGAADASGLFTYAWTQPTGGALSSTSVANPTANPTASGSYTYTVTKTSVASGCKAGPTSVTVTVDVTKPTFGVSLTQPTFCAKGSAAISVCNTAAGATYQYSIDGTTYQSSASFSELGSGDITSVKVKNETNGCVSDAKSCADLGSTGISCTPEVPEANTVKASSLMVEDASQIIPAQQVKSASALSVKAYPNPYSSKVSFNVTSPAAGVGSIDLYNMQGQKLATVYQGRIAAGVSSFEYFVPKSNNSTLVYVLKVDGKTVSGKLMNSAAR